MTFNAHFNPRAARAHKLTANGHIQHSRRSAIRRVRTGSSRNDRLLGRTAVLNYNPPHKLFLRKLRSNSSFVKFIY
jgi:hypothetical protein